MSSMPLVFAATIVLASALGTIALWAPRRLAAKLGALGIFSLFLPVGFAGWSDLLSRPKPIAFEWLQARAGEATVLAGTIQEGERIYVWLQLDGTAEPRAYELPWDREQARELQEALRSAENDGTGVRMRLPFEPSLDPEQPKFYALPQPPLPPKDLPAQSAKRFVPPEQEV
jgi:hypothetical protein